MTVFQKLDIDTPLGSLYDDSEIWEAACREADRREVAANFLIYVTPEEILQEWNAEDLYDGYSQPGYSLYDRIAFDCD